MFQTVIGIIAGVLTSASMLPQFIKVLRKKDVENLSPLMLVTLASLPTGRDRDEAMAERNSLFHRATAGNPVA